MKDSLYKKDFIKWIEQQAEYLKNKEWDKLEVEKVADEFESIKFTFSSRVEENLANILYYLLRRDFAQQNLSQYHENIVRFARTEIELILRESPSFHDELKETFEDAYNQAKINVCMEMDWDIEKLPEICPWKIQELLPFLEEK